MRVARLTIRSIMGAEEIDLQPGSLTIIEGGNAKGKSSILEAIKSLRDGADATLIRNGADKGEVVLLLDDGSEWKRTVTQNSQRVTAKDAAGAKIDKPAERLKDLIDGIAFNPVAFITAQPKQQLSLLLEMLNLKIDPARIEEAIGGVLPVVTEALPEDALSAIDAVRKEVYDQRTGENRSAKEKRAAIEQLNKAIAPLAEDPTPKAHETQRRFNAMEADIAAAKAQALTILNEEKEKVRERIRTETAAVREKCQSEVAELQRQIAEIKQAAAIREGELTGKGLQEIGALEAQTREAIGNYEAGKHAQRDEMQRELAELGAQVRQWQRAIETRESIASLTKQAEDNEALSAGYSAALERLDALKEDLLKNLPVKGLTIRDGMLWGGPKHDVPFHRLNTAERVKIAMRIAKWRAGTLPLVCFDNAECLDNETWAMFEKALPESGLQAFVTRVTQGPLTIRTVA